MREARFNPGFIQQKRIVVGVLFLQPVLTVVSAELPAYCRLPTASIWNIGFDPTLILAVSALLHSLET